ncbi:hypothetical protein [Roseimaritima sediminicola]|uniref:hypothetical protein n=1 Tax=Roseimaritima sediminicola TaxID=2662066 RepID=UPI001F26DEDC|nr:hypothetical protein [Roseimaritima sediminicola]
MKQRATIESVPARWRRWVILALAIVLLLAGVGLRLASDEASGHGQFGSGSMIRLGIVFGAIWLAWPSLRRPATWLPPGMAIALLALVGVVAVQPRLLPALLPAAGLLLTLSAAVRMFRRS